MVRSATVAFDLAYGLKETKTANRSFALVERRRTERHVKMINQNKTYLTYEKLNEQALRALEIIERHREKESAIESHQPMLIPIVDQYLKRQEKLTALKPLVKQALRDGKQAVKELYWNTRSWFGPLSVVIPGFEPGDFSCDVDKPDSVVAAADRLIDFVRSQQVESGSPAGDDNDEDAADDVVAADDQLEIGFASRLVEELTARKEAASAKWLEAQDYLSEKQELRNAIRESALEVQQRLISVRNTLRYTLGRSHRDYQKLCVAKSRHDADESAIELEIGEPIQESDSEDSENALHIVDNDTIEQVPLAATNPSASDDGGNGKGTSAGIAPYLAVDTEINPPSGV